MTGASSHPDVVCLSCLRCGNLLPVPTNYAGRVRCRRCRCVRVVVPGEPPPVPQRPEPERHAITYKPNWVFYSGLQPVQPHRLPLFLTILLAAGLVCVLAMLLSLRR